MWKFIENNIIIFRNIMYFIILALSIIVCILAIKKINKINKTKEVDAFYKGNLILIDSMNTLNTYNILYRDSLNHLIARNRILENTKGQVIYKTETIYKDDKILNKKLQIYSDSILMLKSYIKNIANTSKDSIVKKLVIDTDYLYQEINIKKDSLIDIEKLIIPNTVKIKEHIYPNTPIDLMERLTYEIENTNPLLSDRKDSITIDRISESGLSIIQNNNYEMGKKDKNLENTEIIKKVKKNSFWNGVKATAITITVAIIGFLIQK